MNRQQRANAVEEFSNPSGGTDIMLISLRAGGVGLNLTAASAVILVDPWWNPAIEDQAIDR
jgi:SNF2 family DNA or RNA helicase